MGVHRIDYWGVSEPERSAVLPGDDLIADPYEIWLRGLDVDAPAELTFRWLCQLRRAPYSYDLIDNLGRRSPRELTDGLDRLQVGQRFLIMFRLVGFETGRSITLRSRPGLGPDTVLSYQVTPVGAGRSRLLVKAILRRHRLGPLLAWGDRLMMIKQLRTIAELAAGTARAL